MEHEPPFLATAVQAEKPGGSNSGSYLQMKHHKLNFRNLIHTHTDLSLNPLLRGPMILNSRIKKCVYKDNTLDLEYKLCHYLCTGTQELQGKRPFKAVSIIQSHGHVNVGYQTGAQVEPHPAEQLVLTQAVVVKYGHLQAPVGHLVEAQVLPDQRLLPAR